MYACTRLHLVWEASQSKAKQQAAYSCDGKLVERRTEQRRKNREKRTKLTSRNSEHASRTGPELLRHVNWHRCKRCWCDTLWRNLNGVRICSTIVRLRLDTQLADRLIVFTWLRRFFRANGIFPIGVRFSYSLEPSQATWSGATHFLAHVQHTLKPLPFASHVPKVSQKEKSANHGELTSKQKTAIARVYANLRDRFPISMYVMIFQNSIEGIR